MVCSQKDSFGISSCVRVEDEREQNIAKEKRATVQSTFINQEQRLVYKHEVSPSP